MTAVPVIPRETSLYAFVRPFALLAALAFVLGFLGYLAVGRPALASAAETAAVAAGPAGVSPASDDWNLPKHI
jgi:hypothetical protein